MNRRTRTIPCAAFAAMLAWGAGACSDADTPASPQQTAWSEAATAVVYDEGAFEIAEALTDARTGVMRSGDRAVALEFRAELNEVFTREAADVVATWERAGGIQPEPFMVTIPEGCWMPGQVGFQVEDVRSCGARVTLGGDAVSVMRFEARLVADGGGAARFDLTALLFPPEPILPVLLGTLGGAVVELAIGSGRAGALPLGVETVSGVDPQPF